MEFDEEQGGERDPEMHQTKKGKQWYFGMKAHTGWTRSRVWLTAFATTPANVSDVARAVLRGG